MRKREDTGVREGKEGARMNAVTTIRMRRPTSYGQEEEQDEVLAPVVPPPKLLTPYTTQKYTAPARLVGCTGCSTTYWASCPTLWRKPPTILDLPRTCGNSRRRYLKCLVPVDPSSGARNIERCYSRDSSGVRPKHFKDSVCYLSMTPSQVLRRQFLSYPAAVSWTKKVSRPGPCRRCFPAQPSAHVLRRHGWGQPRQKMKQP